MPEVAQLQRDERRPQVRAPKGDAIPRTQTRYFAFLSYSHRDEELATWLHRELERFRVPHALQGRLTANGVIPKRLTPIFRDEHELAAADDLGEEIENAIGASQFLIVLCSPHAARSRWTNAEIEAFKRVRPDGCVLAAIADGEPFASEIPGREDEDCFPPALRQKYDRRGRPTGKRAEPLAADLRGDGDARRTGFLKIVAGMLGVGLDELVQRETTRRHRRLGYLAAASLAGMAVTSGLAITALQARDSARDQRREAEGLVAFMLGDLKDKLEPIGRLDALDGVGSRVLAYYSKQDAASLSDAALLQRSRALSLTAQVAYQRGKLEEAKALYRQAMAGTGEAVNRAPDDPQRLFDHAQNVFYVGDISRFQGQLKTAEAAYVEYKRLADRMVALETDNLKWRMERAYANENLGIALYYQRRFAEAARQFGGALGTIQNLASIDGSDVSYQKELSTVLAWLADAERAQGRLKSAIATRRRQVDLLGRLAAADPTNVLFRQELIPARQALGILLIFVGERDEGIAQLRGAVAEAERLMPAEPDNRLWQTYAARARLELGKALLRQGRTGEAAANAQAGCGLVLKALGPAPGAWSRSLQTSCFSLQARVAMQTGANQRALRFAERALASAQSETGPDPTAIRYAIAGGYRLLGDARQRTGDLAGAAAAWNAALAALPNGVPELPLEMDERATILERLQRSDEATHLVRRLGELGYRRSSVGG